MALTYYDNFSTDTSGNYTSDYFVTSGSGVPTRTITVSAGRMELSNYGNGAYNFALFRRKSDYEIPSGTNFDFSVNVKRRNNDSYKLGVAFWNNADRAKYLEVQFDDYGNSSNVFTHIETKYSGSPTNPSDPFIVRVRRIGSIYTCWINGSQIFNGAISELNGENLRYGVCCDVTSGPFVTAYASYDEWDMQEVAIRTNMQINISDVLKGIDSMKIKISGVLKDAIQVKQNIGGALKTVFG